MPWRIHVTPRYRDLHNVPRRSVRRGPVESLMVKYHRGERRHQRSRCIQRVFRYERRFIGPPEFFMDGKGGQDAWLFRISRIRATTRTLCACYLCTHDRRRRLGNSLKAWPRHDLKQVASFLDWKRDTTPET